MKSKPSAPVANELARGLRRYLYFTAAITGGAIMIVEILGAKMLAPYLGTSHFVWTAQIAITLVALACGYYAGGRLVDRSLRLGQMYAAILLAGVYLALTIALREPVAYHFLRMRLALGSLLTSATLYFVPLSLLAMVGPFFVRVLTNSVTGVGGNVGRLTAISTLGSFAGTILIGYVLIPFLPNSVTMYLTSLLLMLIALVYFLWWGRTAGDKTAVAVVFLGGIGIGYGAVETQAWNGTYTDELFRGNSNFGQLQVIQQKGGAHRRYLNDYLTQNTYDVELHKSISMFTYMLHGLARAYVPRVDKVLCIGMGVGIVPMEFARDGAHVDVAEINPAVVPVAQKYFNFEPAKVNLFIGDGRYFINESTNRYDAIILDAFLGDSCPSHLMTREAFGAMRRLLQPDGVLVMNTFADLSEGHDYFGASLYKTMTNVFGSVKIHVGRYGNTLYVGSPRTQLEFAHQPDYSDVYTGCLDEVEEAFANVVEPFPEHGRVLTDDYNPVEYYDAANREDIRRRLALGARER